MKNVKYILFLFIAFITLPLLANAGTMSLEGEETENIGKYSLYYTGAEEDGTSVKFEVVTNTNIKPSIEKDSAMSGKCDDSGCYLDLPTNYVVGEKIKVATITLTNTYYEESIITLTVNMNGSMATERKDIKLLAGQTTTKVRSTNANMTDLKLSVGSLDKTFDQNTMDYTVTGIKDTINTVTLTPSCDNCDFTITCPTGGCSITNKTKVKLETGSNNVAINIKSEDGNNNKTYTFNIYRGDIITSSPYLKEIKIKDCKLSPTFDSLNNEYTCLLTEDLKKLEISTLAEDPTAEIKIKGNEKLSLGENTITITVTSSDGENKQVYTVIVTKEEEKTTTKKVVTTKVNKKKNNKWLILLASLLALLIIVGSFILIFKNKKRKKKDKDDNDNDKGNDDTKEEENTVVKENTDALKILDETRKEIENEDKTDVDDALDDLMKTKKLELGDLDIYN